MAKKGFSLFTPLVGTGIVIMTILIASSMVQNDVRISRSITASYITSSQGLAAKLIKASAELHMLEQMKKNAETFLLLGHEETCDVADDCVAATIGYFEDADILNYDLTTSDEGIFEGIIESISLIARYVPTKMTSCSAWQDCVNRITTSDQRQCCMTETIKKIRSVADENFENTDCPYGKYYVRLDPDTMKDPTTMRSYDAFNVEFQSQADPGNKLTVSVIPSALSYVTDRPIGDYICALGDAFETAASANFKDVNLKNLKADEGYMCMKGSDTGNEFLIYAKWGIFNLEFKTSGYISGQYYKLGSMGVIASSTIINPCGISVIPGPIIPGPGPVVPVP